MLFKISQNSQENSCLEAVKPATLFKKRLQHRFFSVNFAKLLRTPFSQNISGRLVLESVHPVDLVNLRKKFCTQRLLTDSAENFSACSVIHRFKVQVQLIVPSLLEAAVYSIQLFFYYIQNRCL